MTTFHIGHRTFTPEEILEVKRPTAKDGAVTVEVKLRDGSWVWESWRFIRKHTGRGKTYGWLDAWANARTLYNSLSEVPVAA